MVLSLRPGDIFLFAIGGWLVYKVGQTLRQTVRTRVKTTKLRGPPSSHWFFGVTGDLFSSKDAGLLFENWAQEFGPVFTVPALAGSTRIVLTDPKAIAHFYSLETFTYVHIPMSKRAIENLVGRGLLWADGESHKRQRRAMTSPFSNAAIRNFTSIFYDSGYHVKANWDSIIESSTDGEAIIDVQAWMNHVSLDSIGIAGFAHDFGSLKGKRPEITDIFDSFAMTNPSKISSLMFMLSTVFPILMKVPTDRVRKLRKLYDGMKEIAEVLLQRTRNEKEVTGDYKYSPGQSIIGALMKAEQSGMTEEEVLAQMQVLILAGYETTSISLTWALLELSLHPVAQEKLRAELEHFTTTDPNYDQLTNELPYLNAVIREVLRLHAPLGDTTRLATEDDIIPLSAPITTASGETVDRLMIAKGTTITVPIRCMNRSEVFWGPDAKEFMPERWIDEVGIMPAAKEIQGFSHLLTFVDGPRTCLGKNFALAEFKSVLSVLIRNYRFAMRDGPDAEIERHRGILPRPKIAGEDGAKVPLRVSRV